MENNALFILFSLCLSPSLSQTNCELVEGLGMYIGKPPYRTTFRSDAGGHPHEKNHQKPEVGAGRPEDPDGGGLESLKGGRDIRSSREKQEAAQQRRRIRTSRWPGAHWVMPLLKSDSCSTQQIEDRLASTSVLWDGCRALHAPSLPCLFSLCKFQIRDCFQRFLTEEVRKEKLPFPGLSAIGFYHSPRTPLRLSIHPEPIRSCSLDGGPLE